MMTTVYLIRHAEAYGNINEVFQGRTDLEVTERGYKQLDQLAERFKEVKLDAIYSSPLKRTVATANAVNRFHDLEIIKLDGIIEIHGGVFEGQPWPELPVRFPEAFDLWKNRHHEFTVEGGESMIEVYDRMKEAMMEIVKANEGKTVAVVSHGCAIRNYICYAEKIPFEELDSLDWCENTGVCKIEFDGLIPKVTYKNDFSHLNEETAMLKKQRWWRK